MRRASEIWRMLDRHSPLRAVSRTLPMVGMMMAARMPMIAMTVSSSIRVKARVFAVRREGG
jgi:hypothetical protein